MKPWLTIAIAVLLLQGAPVAARELTVDQRIAAQEAIEQVYWRHRVWPKENPSSKPALSAVVSGNLLRSKVEDYLKKSSTLESDWHHAVTAEQLQAELDRMSRDSRDPQILRELYAALGNDPFVIAETLARQTLVERLIRSRYASEGRVQEARPKPTFDDWWSVESSHASTSVAATESSFSVTAPSENGCDDDTWEQKLYSPRGRIAPTSVWTGTEMIVWGGIDAGGSVGTGGRYNPATDTWTPTNLGPKAPSPRFGHTAIWTGTEMIIWGGWAGASVNTGSRYDPVTDSWSPTSVSAGVPAARSGFTAVWTGSRMVIWGGSVLGPVYVNSGARYDPFTDTWTPTSTLGGVPSGRSGHTAIWTGNEMIVWGGFDQFSFPLTGGRYNPTADTWTATASSIGVLVGRRSHTAVWTGSEMIVWGGVNNANERQNTGSRYNPTADTWTTLPASALSPRDGHSAVWTGSAMIIWGGTIVTSGYTNSGASWDQSSNTWSPLPTSKAPTARTGHIAVWTGSEMIVWGGSDRLDDNPYPYTGGRYAPVSNSWAPTPSVPGVPSGRPSHTSVWTGTELIVWGGDNGTNGLNNGLNTGGRYNLATDTWVPTSLGANVPTPRLSHVAVWSGTEMIIWGGSDDNTGGRYNPASDTWLPTSLGANTPSARNDMTAVWTGTEMIVWGGLLYSNYLNTGGRYNPSSDAWAPVSTTNAPSPRGNHTAVWTGSRMIVWGGYGFGAVGTGGRYDPVEDQWTPTAQSGAPSARDSHTAVWTGTKMIVWGGTADGSTNSGGRYDPIADQWMPTTEDNAPVPRSYHTAVWTGSEMIVWGGRFGTYGPFDSGGRYDPSTDIWRSTSITNAPPAKDAHTADWNGEKMLVWGGYPIDANLGLYCATECSDPTLTYYRDADQDGYGNPLDSVQAACMVPSGYVLDGTDCDDSRAAVHPGAIETCNGVDDDCDNVIDNDAEPRELAGVVGAKSGMSASFSWPAIPDANTYDVVRGSLGAWPVGSGPESCLAPDTLANDASDSGIPPSDEGYWYLFRGENVCGSGTYGSQASNGVPGAPRISAACP